jgi:hypothetical protein
MNHAHHYEREKPNCWKIYLNEKQPRKGIYKGIAN